MLKLDGKKGKSLVRIYHSGPEKRFTKMEGYSVNYGQRWIAETTFSCIKRTFGEYVYSVRLKNMVKEMMLKTSIV